MVGYCCICKIEQGMIPDVSFHRIPHNPELKAKWFVNIGRNVGNYSSVCSRHFEEKDFSYKIYGENVKRFLVPTAVPSHSVLTHDECKSLLPVKIETEKSVDQKPGSPLNSANNNSESKQMLANIVNTTKTSSHILTNDSNDGNDSVPIEDGDCGQTQISQDNEKECILVRECNVSHAMSGSDFNISVDSQNTKYSRKESTMLKRKLDKPFQSRRILCPRYMGDLSREDFTSEIAWYIVNKHVNNCRKNKRYLANKMKRMTQKIEFLQALLNHLKKNQLSDKTCEES